MKIDQTAQTTNVSTRFVAMCLSREAGGGFEVREVPRRIPAADEIEIAVEAASVNPIDVRRADGYGRRLLSLVGASRFPMTLGNDFAGTIVAAGKGLRTNFRGRRSRLRSQACFPGRLAYLPSSREGRLCAESAAERKHPGSGCAAVFLRDDVASGEGGRANPRQCAGKDCSRAWSGGRFRNVGLADPVGMGSESNRHCQGARPPCLLRRRRDRSDRPQPKSFRDLEGRVRRHAQLRHMERRVKVALLSAAGRAWPRDDRSSVDSKFRRLGLDRRRRPDDEPKKADAGDSARTGRGIMHGFCSSRRRKRFPKWLGSSSKDGSLFRSGLRRRFATSMPPSIMFDFASADGRSWSYDLGPLTAVEDFSRIPSQGFRKPLA